MKEAKEIICQRCAYKWLSKSKLKMITCPNCFGKVPRDKKTKEGKIPYNNIPNVQTKKKGDVKISLD